MLERVKAEVISTLSHFDFANTSGMSIESALSPDINFDDLDETLPNWLSDESGDQANGIDPAKFATLQTRQPSQEIDPNDPETWGRVARNADCPCGSGKKYKHCHGAMLA